MVETPVRRRVDEDSRPAADPAWEAFVREDEAEPLRHVGTLRAPTANGAYTKATRLFAWYAEEVWVCPSDAVSRYVCSDDGAEPVPVTEKDEPRTHER